MKSVNLKENKSITEISTFYEREFFEDMALLNCIRPSIVLRVTQHIPQIIDFIQTLLKNGHAYKASSGSVYFRTQKFSVKSFFSPQNSNNSDQKGKLNNLILILFNIKKLSSCQNNFLLEIKYEKEHEFDFVLWKSRKSTTEPSWESPWGLGRPGLKTL